MPMIFSTVWQDEINVVDPTKILTHVIDPTYGMYEWSFTGLECRGGSTLACETATSELLEMMGFRWYGAEEHFKKRPPIILTSLSSLDLPVKFGDTVPTLKRTSWMSKGQSCGIQFQPTWSGVLGPERDPHLAREWTWQRLQAWGLNDALNGQNTVIIAPLNAGHRWGTIVRNNVGYFMQHPQMIKGGLAAIESNPAGCHFELKGLSPEDYASLVELCAACVLFEGLSEWNTTVFDPPDGDFNGSELVWPFAKAVSERCRSTSVGPIGQYDVQNGNPGTVLNVYAYFNHLAPPASSSFHTGPGVAVVIALAYNVSGFTYDEIFAMWGTKTSTIGVREYLDNYSFTHGWPVNNNRAKHGYMERYRPYQLQNAQGSGHEIMATNFIDLPMMRYVIRFLKTGTYTCQQAIDEVVADIFDGDPAVRALYDLQYDRQSTYNKISLNKIFQYTDDMIAGWYKTYWQQLCVIWYKQFTMPKKPALSVVVTGLSASNPAVCTVSTVNGTRFLNGMKVRIAGADTAHAAANGTWSIAGVTATTFQLVGVDTTSAGVAQTAGVTAYPPMASLRVTAMSIANPVVCTAAPPLWVSGTNYAINATIKAPNNLHYTCTFDPLTGVSTVAPTHTTGSFTNPIDGFGWTVLDKEVTKLANGMTVRVIGCIGGFAVANGLQTIGSIDVTNDTFTLTGVNTTLASGTQTATISLPPLENHGFPDQFASMTANVIAIRQQGTLHSYGWARYEGAVADANPWPALGWTGGAPFPCWHDYSYLPTEGEFNTMRDALFADVGLRDPALDSSDLVVMSGITVPFTRPKPISKTIYARNEQTVYVVGPCELTYDGYSPHSPPQHGWHGPLGKDKVEPGFSLVTTPYNSFTTFGPGLAFYDTYPKMNKGNVFIWETDADGNPIYDEDGDPINIPAATAATDTDWWLYVQQSVAGSVNLEADIRWTFYESSGGAASVRYDLLPEDNVSYVSPANLGPGHVAIDNRLTAEDMYNYNVNRYVSPRPDVALMPREMVLKERTSHLIARWVP